MSLGNQFMESLFNCCCTHRKIKKKYNLIENKITPSDISDCCSICLDDLTQYIIILPKCKHKFHSKCIIDWFDIKLECPLCKTSYLSLND